MASKGTGGGLISANCHGPAKFIAPGSMTVKIEGKNVHLLGDSMLNNLGPSGSPPNTGATMMGADHTDLSIETRCKQAREAAEKRADEIQAEPGPRDQKPATVSGMSNTNGRVSTGVRGFQLPLVSGVAQQFPSPNDHKCAELTAISKNVSLNGLETVRGSVMITVNVRPPGHPDHKTVEPPCDGCKPLLQAMGIIDCSSI